MTFSDRIEEVCREFNLMHSFSNDKKNSEYSRTLSRVEERTINYVLGTLGVPLVRDASGYITAFEIMGAHREVRS